MFFKAIESILSLYSGPGSRIGISPGMPKIGWKASPVVYSGILRITSSNIQTSYGYALRLRYK